MSTAPDGAIRIRLDPGRTASGKDAFPFTVSGAPDRLGDWLTFFGREVREQPWRAVLETWWPRLLPGIAAGATHGVIRTGHAVHALLQRQDETRLAELGQALGYWAARWQPIAGFGAPSGTAGPGSALAALPRVPDQSKGINHRLEQLAEVAEWGPALASLKPAADAGQARAGLIELADAATLRYLTHAHGSPIMLVHAATAPTAVLRTLPALPAHMWGAGLDAAWAAAAAVTAAYAPAAAATRREPPTAPG
ncbi:questin oxidase family protein [Spongiactinospora gelatinilytica]|uniref:questin oxidase family protein n=1 Tax=Spongiactinospora gelatinilytica TaxID=2666298 RepID=UPI0018F4AC22|nr:questin oxidase family protein [Spongiactinospora gelatinilytica]